MSFAELAGRFFRAIIAPVLWGAHWTADIAFQMPQDKKVKTHAPRTIETRRAAKTYD